MGLTHIIPTTGYKALFTRFTLDEEEDDLPVPPDDCLIFPVLAFALREDSQGNQEICGLILDADGKPAVCEDAKFAAFKSYLPPADGPHVTRTIASLIRMDERERGTRCP